MAKKRLTEQFDKASRTHWITIPVSLLALGVSIFSWQEAREARNLNYLTSLPALGATVELAEPIQPGKTIIFRVVLENQGGSIAKKLNPELRFLFSPASATFTPDYSPIDSFGRPRFAGISSDLNRGAKTTLLSTSSLSLAHEHDIEAVKSGSHILYLYGRASYFDVYEKQHELRFCRYYQPVPGDEPMKLKFCNSYNETVDLGM